MAKTENKPKYSSDRERLDFIKDIIMKKIEEGAIDLKVGDLLKILEIQKKLTNDAGAQEKFWEFIEQIRQEELPRE